MIKVKVSLTNHENSEGGWNVGLTILTWTFGITRTAELSSVCTGRNLFPNEFLGTHFSYSLSGPQGYCMRMEEISHLNTSRDTSGNRTRNLTCFGAVPQPTAPFAPLGGWYFESANTRFLRNVHTYKEGRTQRRSYHDALAQTAKN